MIPGSSPSLLISGISCAVSLGEDGNSDGISESWPGEGAEADVTLECYWEDRYALAKALMGSADVIGGVLVRRPAFKWPESNNLSCISLGEIRPLGMEVLQTAVGSAPAGWVRAKTLADGKRYAIVPAHFGVPRYSTEGPSTGIGIGEGGSVDVSDPSGQAWTTTTFNFSGEVFQPPNGTFYYQDGGSAWVPVHDSLLGIVRPKVEISIVRHFVPSIDLAGIAPFIGKVNLNNVRFANLTFAPGFLLFGGFKGTKVVDVLGNIIYMVEYGLLGQTDYSWNKLMGQDSEWHQLSSTDTGTGPPPFLFKDFAEVP